MKKSIGLYADTRNFRTTLPQTKHLNFFMQTNPQGYANGGQVRAGIPQSNMKVTSGFLPMALGYQDGGEPFSFSELYRAIVKVTAEYLGKSEDDPQVQEEAEKIAKTEEGQELAKKILTGQTVSQSRSLGLVLHLQHQKVVLLVCYLQMFLLVMEVLSYHYPQGLQFVQLIFFLHGLDLPQSVLLCSLLL